MTGIGAAAFSGCGSMKSITIPAGVIVIGDEAFYNCRALESISIPGNVKSIGFNVFELCGSLSGISVDPGNRNYSSADGILYDKAAKRCLSARKEKPEKL